MVINFLDTSHFQNTLGPTWNEFDYFEHPASTSNFYLVKDHFLLSSVFSKFGYSEYHWQWTDSYEINYSLWDPMYLCSAWCYVLFCWLTFLILSLLNGNIICFIKFIANIIMCRLKKQTIGDSEKQMYYVVSLPDVCILENEFKLCQHLTFASAFASLSSSKFTIASMAMQSSSSLRSR